MTETAFEYLPLDNAGSVFPGQNSSRWSNVFRLSVDIGQKIDPDTLRRALESALKRIPSMRVRMRYGFFCNYLEPNKEECPINEDIANFCYRINFKENNGYLFRVYYRKSRISVDFYHALCDGHSGTVFIYTLIGEYLRLKGETISSGKFVLDTKAEETAEELEDAYLRYCGSDSNASLTDPKVYHKKGVALPPFFTNYTAVFMSFKELHQISKALGVTVTELFAAILMEIHYRDQLKKGKMKKPVSVQIPVNLRGFFPSESLRNFVLCVLVRLDKRKEEYTFEEILKEVSTQLRAVNNKKAHQAYITSTVKLGARALKYIPVRLKNLFIKIGFMFGAEYSTSTLLSNLGYIDLPEDIRPHIKSMSFYTGPGLVNGARCGVACAGDRLVITFSDRYDEDEVERAFIKKLSELGVNTLVETNRDTRFGDIEGVTDGDEDAYSDMAFIPSSTRFKRLPRYKMSLKERISRYFRI